MRFGALGLVGAAAALTLALLLGDRASLGPATTQVTVPSVGPVALSAHGLKARVGELNQVVYWLGPARGYRYELTRTTNNYVYVRYLPPGVEAGTHQGKFPLVATYPLARALASLKASAHRRLLKVQGANGAVAVVEPGTPTNVRVAYPGVDFEIEIYARKPHKARLLATSGDLRPVP